MRQSSLQQVPRAVVRSALRVSRLPLQAVATVAAGGEHAAEWPPTLAFDAFEAQVKQVAGALLRDDELTQEGRLETAKVAQLRKAAELETVAERRAATAAAQHEAEERAARDRRRRTEREASEAEKALERERAAREREVEQEARREREQARRAEAAAQKAVERQERAAERTRVEKERAALRKERDAVAAKRQTLETGKRIRTSAAKRKATR
jgi:hypothetical protein